jgi:HlyD family secretion protein
MDRDISPEVRRRRLVRRVATVLIAIAVIGFSFGATLEWLRPSVKRRDLQFARVERGTVDATLQGSGTVLPAVEQVVSSPLEARVLRITRRPGDRVRAGDELLILDNSSTRLEFERVGERLTQKQSESATLTLQIEESISDLRAELQQKKLDAEILHLKAEQMKRLREAGLTSDQDALAAATAARKIDIELVQTEEKIARTARSGQARIAAARSEAGLLQKDREESRRQLELSMMRADRDGIITSLIQEEGTTVRRGDILARIADLSSFRVDATISDLHAAALTVGMPVRVRIDEATYLNGRISSIEPRIENGAVKFHIALDNASNRKLRNNVRVDVYPVAGRRENVLRIKRGYLGHGDQEGVFVVRGDSLVRVPVRWGLGGQEHIQPLSGLAPGDEVVISNMTDYAGVKTLRLK